ncbi:uncharacterized protein LOC124664732 [Lolium rigidum]|uniref:uncharacterized protein LOC124664732 n=1 Tax=Lolium rigidum TaxID=89674 RepID=UPI001F5DA4CA|nr:uncharacterized protein LOC124664732 [Lolium rigidum]
MPSPHFASVGSVPSSFTERSGELPVRVPIHSSAQGRPTPLSPVRRSTRESTVVPTQAGSHGGVGGRCTQGAGGEEARLRASPPPSHRLPDLHARYLPTPGGGRSKGCKVVLRSSKTISSSPSLRTYFHASGDKHEASECEPSRSGVWRRFSNIMYKMADIDMDKRPESSQRRR